MTSDQTKGRIEMKRTRTIATTLLVFMAVLFLGANAGLETYPFLGWVRAFAEAAMVGALADWYAVTALFRKPFGLPIPHTQIIPRNKHRIAKSLGHFTETKLLTPDKIIDLIHSWNIAGHLTSTLTDPVKRRSVTHALTQLIVRAIHVSEDHTLQRFIREIALKALQGMNLSKLVGQVLHSVLQREEFLEESLRIGADYLTRNKTSLRQVIAEGQAWYWRWTHLDRLVARRILKRATSVLVVMQSNADDPIRKDVTMRLNRLAERLMSPDHAGDLHETINQLLKYEPLLEYLEAAFLGLKQWALKDLDRTDSDFGGYVDDLLRACGESLKNDPDISRILNEGIRTIVDELVRGKGYSSIRQAIEAKVNAWSADELVEIIENEVGRDLQFIRINGTLVGGMVGLMLYAIVVLMGKT